VTHHGARRERCGARRAVACGADSVTGARQDVGSSVARARWRTIAGPVGANMRGVDSDPIPRTVAWTAEGVRLIDQRALPGALEFVTCTRVDDVAAAIGDLVVRGAPAIGAAAAYGVALAARDGGGSSSGVVDAVRAAAARLGVVRPTAVNLARGAAAVVSAVTGAADAGERDARALQSIALAAAEQWADDDVRTNRALGAHGAALVPDGGRVLTHCNAGGLACVGYGTALGVVRSAVEGGARVTVWVDETRPVLQGARLTAWELDRLGIEATVIADGLAGSLLADGLVDVVIVGADRVAANGDVANKVGTYPLAVLADRHGVPFVVAAPTSTIDLDTATGRDITVEERGPDEVLSMAGVRIAPAGARALNRAFDVTPAELVGAIVTEHGVATAPYPRSLAALVVR